MLPSLQNIPTLLDGVSRQATTFDLDKRSKTKPVAPGETVTLAQAHGAGTITRIWMTFPGWFWQHWNAQAKVGPTILKTLILRIYWDGEATPAVEAPAGDFFGVGHCEYRHFTSLPLGMSSGGFYCYWPMPYRKGFRVEVENRDEHTGTDVFFNANYHEVPEARPDKGWFAAQFHTGRRTRDQGITVLDTQGRGHCVGITLSMQGEPLNYLSFLEAPEYIYIDDDWDRPRIVGTGLEDYFNGGWYFREGEFAGPLHGVPLKDALRSMISMYRFHLADAIAFERRIRIAFLNPWTGGDLADHLRNYWYSSVAYYYSDRPAPPRVALPDRAGLLSMYRTRDRDHQSIP
jgi:hypothetical protein